MRLQLLQLRYAGAERAGVNMDIKVLGPGCGNCQRLYAEAVKALQQLGMTATITKVEKFEEIRAYRIMATPGLVINGQVKAAGRIPNASEITTWLATAAMDEEQAAGGKS